jgi:type IX secretion system PorP/SprF family membrane protein
LNYILAFLFFAVLSSSAQHYSLFSQYLVNGLVINPAYAGKNEVLDVTVMHRRQWTGLAGAPVTSAFSVNTPFRNKSLNAGLTYQSDQIGSTNSQYLSGVYAYRFRAGKMKISLGVQAGFFFSRTRWDQLKKNDADDLLLLNATQNQNGFFAGSGIYLHNEKFFAGISAPYFMSPSGNNSPMQTPLILNGGYLIKIKDAHTLKPSALIRYTQGSPLQADVSLNYYYSNRFGFGCSYRLEEALIFIGEFQVNEQFRIAYSYDLGINRLANYHSGSHEILMRYYFGYSRKARNPRAFLY